MRLEDHIREIDPLEADAPVPDGEALLERILATPVPVRRAPRRRSVRAPLAIGGVACLLGGALVLALPRGAPTDALAAAYAAVSDPGTVLHYREHWVAPGSVVSRRQDLYDVEVWQAGDGSRGRALARFPGSPPSTSEDVWSSHGTRAWNSLQENRIVASDRRHAPRTASPGAAYLANRGIGDPRTLLERTRGGDARVTQLADGTVRGIPVLRFRVGRCQVTARSVRWAAVVSIGRDNHLPIRVEQPPCRQAPAGQVGLMRDEQPGFTVDYLSFEVLPADAANRRALEMSPHPGAKVVDGAAIDAAER